MTRLPTLLAAGLLTLALGACGPTSSLPQPTPVQVSTTLLGTYDTAVAAEEVYLATKPPVASVNKVRAARLKAWTLVQKVVAAEKSGGNAAAEAVLAQAALDEFTTASKGQ